jgi:hypothetical protein
VNLLKVGLSCPALKVSELSLAADAGVAAKSDRSRAQATSRALRAGMPNSFVDVCCW